MGRVVTLEELRKVADVIADLARQSSLRDVRVFGSVARGEATPDSDIDLLVTPSRTTSLFPIAQFEMAVEELTGRPVTALSVTALNDRDAQMLQESVAL